MATKKKTMKGKTAKAKSAKSTKPKATKKVVNKKASKPVKKAVAKKPMAKKPVQVKAKKAAAPKVKAVKKPVVASVPVKKAPAKNVYVKPIVVRPPVNRNNIAAHSSDKAVVAKGPVQKPVASKAVTPPPAAVVPTPRPIRPVMPTPPPHKTVPVKATVTPVQRNSNGTEKTRYADPELKEFKILIEDKLSEARIELVNLNAAIISANENGTDDTGASFKMLEDGSDTLAKEEAAQLAARQKKFIEQLEAALIRIENKTYGVCRVTGKLIPKERLRAVPHTTQTMEAKLQQYKD